MRDTTAPATRLGQDVPDRGNTASFTFTADEPATFACSLDSSAYRSCTSPVSYTDLSAGWHTFAVRATDTSGNVDSSPASTSWHSTGQTPTG